MRRLPEQVADRAGLDAVLDAGRVGHVAVLDPDAQGTPTCLTVTLVDGPDRKEMAATLDLPVWAGVVPLETQLGTPVPAPDLRGAPRVPAYLAGWSAR